MDRADVVDNILDYFAAERSKRTFFMYFRGPVMSFRVFRSNAHASQVKQVMSIALFCPRTHAFSGKKEENWSIMEIIACCDA